MPSDNVLKEKHTNASFRQKYAGIPHRHAGSDDMNTFWGALRLAGIVTILMVLTPAAVQAEDSSPDTIEFRWVLAGLDSDADPPYLATIPVRAALRTGDKIKMYLETHRKCFFYLFHQAPGGRIVLLFPSSLPSEAIAGGTQLTVPQGDRWFQLDEQTGTETFHVLIAAAALRTIETLYEAHRQDTANSGVSSVRLILAIEQLRNHQRPLTSKAERPLAVGGTLRGSGDIDTAVTAGQLDHLAEDITTSNIFCRTYKIEHQ
jgi:uncharacterized protein DUF4384